MTGYSEKQLVGKICDYLCDRGFEKRPDGMVEKRLSANFYFWIGLNRTIRRRVLEIYPFSGLHCVPIQKMWRNLAKPEYKTKYSRSIATYALSMIELVDDWNNISFPIDEEPSRTELDRLRSALYRNSLPYFSSKANYDELLILMKQRAHTRGGYPEKIAACLFLMDRKSEALAFSERFYDFDPHYSSFFLPKLRSMIEVNCQNA